MTWLHAFIADRLLRRSVSSNPAFVHSAPTPAAYGPVATTETPQKQGGARTLLSRRAERLHNRNRKAASRYLTIHEILEGPNGRD
jgi:hypothetical protein